MTELECCLELGGNAGPDGVADTCYDATVSLPDYEGITDLPMDSACYYLEQTQANGGAGGSGFNWESAGGFLESLGSFANNILSAFGLGATQDSPLTSPGGSGVDPSLGPETQDKSRRNTLLILGLISAVVIGFAAYTILKKKR